MLFDRALPRLLIAAALLAAPAITRAATPTPPAEVDAFLGVSFTRASYVSQTPGSYTNDMDGVDETVNWGVHPAPFLEATVKGRGNMRAGLTYNFDVAGPTDIGEIPLFLTGRLSLVIQNAPSAYGVAIADTEINIYDGNRERVGGTYASVLGTAGPNGQPALTRGFSLPFNIQPNTTGQVSLITRALVRQGMQFMPESMAYAMIDPVLSIDPAYLAAHPGVRLNISPTIGNGVAAVPEPASWAMMIVGFGTVGATLRRRRRVAAAA